MSAVLSAVPRVTMGREWAMPSADTFSVKPIGQMVRRYLKASRVSIDPFARNSGLATYTNDLNPETSAQDHMDAAEWMEALAARGVVADLMLFDPPYSPPTDCGGLCGHWEGRHDGRHAKRCALFPRQGCRDAGAVGRCNRFVVWLEQRWHGRRPRI